jgi:hypothetical protein
VVSICVQNHGMGTQVAIDSGVRTKTITSMSFEKKCRAFVMKKRSERFELYFNRSNVYDVLKLTIKC